MDGLWIYVLLNFLISCWNGYASGIIYVRAKDSWDKYLAYFGLVLAYSGLLYTIFLVGILVEYLPPEWMLVANVYIGLPMILAGCYITIAQIIDTIRLIQEARRTGKGWRWVMLYVLVDTWNLFATFHNIRVWIDSVRLLGEIGGVKGVIKSTKKGKPAYFILLALIVITLIIVGMFRLGKEHATAQLEVRNS